jgi:NhaC family Na+:H+ antiporter
LNIPEINTEDSSISFFKAVLPLLFLMTFLICNVTIFEDTLAGPNQLALILSAFVGMLVARSVNISWDSISKKIVSTIGAATPSILILLVIGALSGTWLISGVVPAMVYYGLSIISPQFFLITAVLVCAVVSVVTGSSWSTIATVGVALIGIGGALGFSMALSAGAIISGAYFGDKMSPLSDTTNLAPAMTGAGLFSHIKFMMITTIPTMVITLIIFFIIGLTYDFHVQAINVSEVQQAIKETFNITPWLLLVPVILFFIIIKKIIGNCTIW